MGCNFSSSFVSSPAQSSSHGGEHMAMHAGSSQDFESATRTVVNKTKIKGRHRWIIEGFSSLPIQRTCITSPSFQAGGRNWELFLHNDGHNAEYAGCVSVFLQLLNPQGQNPVHCGFRFSLLHPQDSKKSVQKPQNGNFKYHTFKTGDANWGFYELKKRDLLINEGYLWKPNDALVVEVEMEVTTGQFIQHESVSGTYLPSSATAVVAPVSPCHCSMRKEIADLLHSGRATTDVVFCVGGLDIRAHRAILSARSSVFHAMFRGWSESKEQEILIDDIRPATMQSLIEFMYTDALPASAASSWEESVNLFQAADKYNLDRLMELCVPTIAKYISLQNVFSTLQLAETSKHSAGGLRLRRAAQDYARAHWEDLLDVVAKGGPPVAFDLGAARNTKPDAGSGTAFEA